jgi:hypothetical protein
MRRRPPCIRSIFLELTLQDEIDRRERKNLTHRLERAGFDEQQTFEEFDWDVPVSFDRDRVRDLFSLGFLDRREDIIFLGPVGVGKTSMACALGYTTCRAGRGVLFLRSDPLLKTIQSRADNSTERVLRTLLAPDLLIIDDFGLRRLNAQQSSVSTRSSSSDTDALPPSSRPTAPSRNGSPSSMTPSSPRARSIVSRTTATRSSWTDPVTGAGSDPATAPTRRPNGRRGSARETTIE